MTPEETLPIIAQLAATFAGFTALVSVVDQGQGGRWAKISIWRILQMLSISLGLIFLCFVPSLLSSLEVPADRVWWLANAVFVAATVVRFSSIVSNVRKLGEQRARLNHTVFVTAMGATTIPPLLSLLGLIGLLKVDLAGLYLLGMLGQLLAAAVIFFALISQLDQDWSGSEPPDKKQDND